MKFEQIAAYDGINATDDAKVAELVESIKANGWQGAPILVCDNGLVTGSHRLAALKAIYEADLDFEYDELFKIDVAEDVSEEVIAYCEKTGIGYDQIHFDDLSDVFAGTWVEEFADQIVEW